MFADIEITQLSKPSYTRYQTDRALNSHNGNLILKQSQFLKGEAPGKQQGRMKIVPIKEYSNKFLRESASKQNQKDREEYTRVNVLVNKHKSFQKKYHKVLGKKHYVCKTEPNQNQYQCFSTAKNFYKQAEPEVVRIKTESMIDKNQSKSEVQRVQKEERKRSQPLMSSQQPEIKLRTRYDCLVGGKKQEKISTSRALELFAKIVSKDKNELIDRIRMCNQSKLLKEKLMESSKNLEAKQMVLVEKVKKFSFLQKGQRKLSIKTSLKHRHKKKSEPNRLFEDEDSFEIKGWDFPY